MFRRLRHNRLQAGLQRANLLVGALAPVCALAGWFMRRFSLQPGRSAGRSCDRPARRPETMITARRYGGFGRAFGPIVLAVALLGSTVASGLAATTPGTRILNLATATYSIGGVDQSPANSNLAWLIVRSPATIEFLAYAPGNANAEEVNVPPTLYSTSGTQSGPFTPLLPPLPGGLSNPLPLVSAEVYHTGQPQFIRLTDLDQNTDPAVAETVRVQIVCAETGDTEWLIFTETGPDTGQFTGYIPSSGNTAISGDGILSVIAGCTIECNYTDPADGTDSAAAAALVDPFGIVFDSRTGQPVDGVSITLIDNATGVPATVLGDDGVSSFPATITSGGTETDSSGTLYTFPPGGFRFPLIAPGDYRFEIAPTVGYTAPSTIADDVLQALPGAPFALDTGSRAEVFTVAPGPALQIDIPIDPRAGSLWLQKRVNQDLASVGDFLQYRLSLQNIDGVAIAQGVIISDYLPLGLRYQDGSTRINDTPAADPQIDRKGRRLSFTVGDLPPDQIVTVSYVVEVAAGTGNGEAINRAHAVDISGVSSNLASSSVRIVPAFFNDVSFLAGRVLTGSCGQDEQEMAGVAGVRIYLEDGSYVVTDDQGRYHFEGVEPGVHVVQADLASLPTGYEMIPCEQTTQTSGRAFSQFVDLQGGTLWRVNFYTAPEPPPNGQVSLAMQAELNDDSAGFTIDIESLSVSIDNLRLTVMLPGESLYLAGTARQDGQPVTEPQASPGVVTFRIPQLAADRQLRLQFAAQLDQSAGSDELPAKAVLMFDTPAAKSQRTPVAETRFRVDRQQQSRSDEIKLYPHFPSFVAELQETDQAMLEQFANSLAGRRITRVDVVGHSDNQQIVARSRKLFSDNQALSEARARNVAAFLGERLQLPAEVLSVRGMGEDLPVADNDTSSGRALNRRVDLFVVTEEITVTNRLELTQSNSSGQSVATTGLSPAIEPTTPTALAPVATMSAPLIDQAWLENAQPSVRLLWPVEGIVPKTPSTTIMVQHERGQKVALTLNDTPSDPLNFNGTEARQDGLVAVSAWKGVDLKPGLNRIAVVVTDNTGQEVGRETRELWYVDKPQRAELLLESSVLLADGVTPPVLAVRLTDQAGHPVRPGLYAGVSVASPYQARSQSDPPRETSRDQGNGKASFEIGADGIALIQLEPTSQAGEVQVSIPLIGETAEIRAWLKPVARDWILVGFAEGTVGYDTVSGNQVSLDDAGIDDHYYDDGQVKLFAKGAIKGEWLLTLAYDSDKPDLDGDSLYQRIDPNSYYPLYGDGTQQGYEASSAHKLFLKLERDQFYALFGDMNTGLTQTTLTRYNRSMSGFKSEMQSEHFIYTMFAAETKQAFVQDEIRGDGTSGYYYLSQKNLVINSEEVVIETRDRFRSEIILDSQSLRRYSDYDIDYDDGSLTFKRPVPSKNENLNPVFIVVRYETKDSGDANLNYGGRAAIKVLNQKVELGGTYVHEENGGGKGDLYGVDATAQLTPQTSLHVEAARTENKYFDDRGTDNAYLAEISHDANRIKTRAYYLEQDEGFGLGQQNSSESGTRKYGTEALYHFTPKFSIAALAYHEEVMANDNKRDVGELDARYQAERYGLNSGFRHAEDRLGDGRTMRSEQLLAGGYWLSADTRLKLRADHEQSLKGMNKNIDYPTRSIMGLDYQLSRRISTFAEQEFTWGEEEDTQGTRVGLKANPWQGGELSTAVEQQMSENSQRVFAIFGLDQTWRITENWSMDAALDRSYTVKSSRNYQFNDNVPTAQGGDDDFTSVSVGSTYRKEKWTWWNRLETRQADNEDKYGVSASVVVEPKDGIALSAKALAFISDVTGGTRRTDGNIRLGLAYRPTASRWIVLNRLDFYFDREDNSPTEYDSWRIVNNLHGNFRLNSKVQMSSYYGLKYVRDNFDGSSYSGYTDLFTYETRYNITKRWDIGVHGGILHSWNSQTLQYSAGTDIGYSPVTNTWISVGYNIVGFEDEDFSGANYTAQGLYIRFRAKFDQQSVREAAAWLNR